MAVNRRPGGGGRKKKVTGGGGGVHRRGSAIGGNGGRPVGKSGGYSGRKSSSGSSGGGSRDLLSSILGGLTSGNGSPGGSSTGSGGISLSGCTSLLSVLGLGKLMKTKVGKIIVFAVIALIIIALISNCTGGSMCGGSGSAGGGLSSCMMASPAAAYTGVAGENSASHAADTSVASAARAKYCDVKNADSITIMVYMCGTDLESKYGMATNDIKEMLNAKIGDNVNLIIETGGCSKWNNNQIASNTNQIWQIKGGGLLKLADLGKKSMVDPSTLTGFINYCAQNFPAERNMLIMWDHGGGSVSGFGYDETSPSGSLTLDKLDSAIAASNVKFDIIGFDACLMATLETALVMEDYADYLLASEETEPGCGWYYTNWLRELSAKPNMSSVELGKRIVDDFVDTCYKNSPVDKTTLSIVDLAEMDGTVNGAFTNFAMSVNTTVNSDYKIVSDARSKTKEFSSGINQCDLINLCDNLGTVEAKALANALRGCVKYNRTSKNIGGANGLSIYFPYGNSKNLDKLISTYNKIGMDSAYTECVRSFANVTAGGQIASGGLGSQTGSLFGTGSSSLLPMINMLGGSGTSASNTDLIGTLLTTFLSSGSSSSSVLDVGQLSSWFSSDKVMQQKSYYENNYLDPSSVINGIDTAGSVPVLRLTDAQWELVQDIELNVFYDDGAGYIDLGMDNVYEFDNEGNLIVDYDGTWLYFNNHVVSYYMESCDEYCNIHKCLFNDETCSKSCKKSSSFVITGRVPAMLNGQLVDIIVQFDNENEDGVIVGARINYNGATDVMAKGMIEIKNGDVIDFLCDYYDYNGTYKASYKLGEQMVVNGDISISNKYVQGSCSYSYCLTDIYGNKLWTPVSEYIYTAQ